MVGSKTAGKGPTAEHVKESHCGDGIKGPTTGVKGLGGPEGSSYASELDF